MSHFGTREKDGSYFREVGKSYAMLLGHGARRGVNTTALKWDRPCRCLVINILGTKTGNTGAGLVSGAKC